MAQRVGFVAWILLFLVAAFPIVSAVADLVSDLVIGLRADHKATFAVLSRPIKQRTWR